MLNVLAAVAPAFILIGLGYLIVYRRYMTNDGIDALMYFAQTFCIPVLLFNAVATLDLSTAFDWGVMLSYYIPASIVFITGMATAFFVFGRTAGASVPIAFTGLFSNMVLIGFVVSERAFGTDSLQTNYALASVHVLFCYLLGISTIEALRADGRGLRGTVQTIARTIFKNAIAMGLILGFVANFVGLVFPAPIQSALDLLIRAALPVALIGLGGVLVRYSLRNNLPEVAALGIIKLILFPAMAYICATYVFDVSTMARNSIVITAAMPPGINTYIFANIYNRGKATAASAVVILTALSVLTVSGWLLILT